MNYDLADHPIKTPHKSSWTAANAMTDAFTRKIVTHGELLACPARSVAAVLLETWGEVGHLNVFKLPSMLHRGGNFMLGHFEPRAGFPATTKAEKATQRVLSEAWAVLVAEGHVAFDIFGREWFVTRAGIDAWENSE